ncbi:ChaN family lipoprotein [Pyxidicoccus caerfyrddinensis]|uniref:ChaN family lipoprotein n=1 Tax=Pyxidicoccus caerfyrddinensis TaxID=2709663 RepID=UPI0013DAAB71|nr:ChaN family lipoprotein [Pyxidicoccus caerfyrddinensis]
MSLFSRCVLGLSFAVSLSGCAQHAARTEAVVPMRFAQALQVPVATTLATARQVLEEKGFSLEEARNSGQLVTTWKETTGPEGISRERFLVTGISTGPERSVVRIFRMTDGGSRRREPELEGEVAARVEAGLASGAIRRDTHALPASTPVRDEAFYLTRWQDELRCLRKVRGLEEVLKPGLVMLIGEQLGSREAPMVVGDVVCQAAGEGLSVTLGLSIPHEEQAHIDRYLASAGTPVDQDALLEGHFWRRPYQDGRSSRAVFDLIDRVRAMRELGMSVSLVAYDTDEVRASERDAVLADVWLKRHAARPEEVLVVLAGNAHVRTVTGVPWDRDFTPMAHHLQSLQSLRILELGYARGKRWGCGLDNRSRLDCRIVGAEPEPRVADHPGLSPYVRFYPSPTEEGYQGLLFVGPLSASLPALEPVKKQQRPTGEIRPSAPPPRYYEPPPQRAR